jgi:branched-chain amino acid transport system permease protein
LFWQACTNSIVAAAIYALVGLSFGLIYLPVRFFHFAHGAIIAWGAYLCYAMHAIFKFPLWAGAVFAVFTSALIGIVIEVGVYRPARRVGATATILLLVSLGLYVVLQNLLSLAFGDDTKALQSWQSAKSFHVYGASITCPQLLILGFAFAAFCAVWSAMKFTTFGKIIRAVACDSELAMVNGVNRDRTIRVAFAIGSGLAAVAGILVSLDVAMTPTMGLNLLMPGIVTVVIGGIDSAVGLILGALLLGLAQNFGVWKFGTEWQEPIAFGVLIAFLLWRPQGFFGKPLRSVGI